LLVIQINEFLYFKAGMPGWILEHLAIFCYSDFCANRTNDQPRDVSTLICIVLAFLGHAP